MTNITLPHFQYPIVEELYRYDFSIDRQLLEKIISLGNRVIPDLEMILTDIITHDQDYSKQEDFNWYTPTHALHLLGELRAGQSLPWILDVFRQDEDFLEFWFSGGLNEEMWEVIYKCGQNSLDLIEAFLKDQSVWLYARIAVAEGLKQIALHHPENREKIITIYKKVIEATIPFVKYRGKSHGGLLGMKMKKDDAKDAIAFYVCDLLDFNQVKVNSYLTKLFAEGVVETTIVGPESIHKDSPIEAVKEIKSIVDRYDELERIYNRHQESDRQPISQLQWSKVGRNEPCPCESGKKFKRCCYLK